MSWLSHLSHLGVTESDLGVGLFWECPKCEAQRDFNIIQSRGNWSIVGFEFTSPVMLLDLRCSKCNYEVRALPEDRPTLIEAAKETRRLKGGSVSMEAYRERIRSLPAKCVATLIALNDSWKCMICGETSPGVFDTCWKCRSKKPAAGGAER